MEEQQPSRFPLLRIMFGNAFLLSISYLAIGLVIDSLRRWAPAEWIDRASLVIDSLPARTLLALGVMGRLREAYIDDRFSGFAMRLVFSLTTLGIIFVLALVVGALMWLVRWVVERRAHSQAGGTHR